MGRGPGKLGGEEAVTVASHFAPQAAEANNRISAEMFATFRALDLTDDSNSPRSRSKVRVSLTID
jgi:hypothetical protein